MIFAFAALGDQRAALKPEWGIYSGASRNRAFAAILNCFMFLIFSIQIVLRSRINKWRIAFVINIMITKVINIIIVGFLDSTYVSFFVLLGSIAFCEHCRHERLGIDNPCNPCIVIVLLLRYVYVCVCVQAKHWQMAHRHRFYENFFTYSDESLFLFFLCWQFFLIITFYNPFVR